MTTDIENLNQWLRDTYGLFEGGDKPNYRLVWSDDEYEARKGTFVKTDLHGNYLGETETVKFVPKYKQWCPHRYILERLIPVPELGHDELSIHRVSYEPVWVFQDRHGEALPPKREACWLIVKTIQKQLADAGKGPKYSDPDSNPEEAKENQKLRVIQLEQELFGNETQTGDALAHQRAIVVPKEYQS